LVSATKYRHQVFTASRPRSRSRGWTTHSRTSPPAGCSRSSPTCAATTGGRNAYDPGPTSPVPWGRAYLCPAPGQWAAESSRL